MISKEKIAKYMKCYHITREEAIQAIKDDEIIDKGGTCDWEKPMTKEDKKILRELHGTEHAKTGTKTRSRKEDNDKRDLVSCIENALTQYMGVVNLVKTNIEKELVLEYNGRKFKISLSAPRS